VIWLASRNPGKLRDMQHLLAALGEPLALPEGLGEIEETGATFEENALLKARAVARGWGGAAIGDDSGLEVDALGGAPGVYSARYAGHAGSGEGDGANNALLLERLGGVPPERRTARFRSVLAFVDASGMEIVAGGVCEGVILGGPRGSGGFGYDPLFFSPELGKTFAEASIEEKARVSHRARAAAALLPRVRAHLEVAKAGSSR
jgi:XTP/dITP diphosphohydrolase